MKAIGPNPDLEVRHIEEATRAECLASVGATGGKPGSGDLFAAQIESG
jgi:hypothetical protein